MIIWIILFSVLGSLGSIISATGFLVLKDETQNKLVPLLIAFANGTLLTSALIGLIPEAIEEIGADPTPIFFVLLVGIIIFFLLEKVIIWHHCHDATHECDVHAAAGSVILFGDLFHNLIDGIIIASGFLSSFTLGLAVSLSVIAHEVSQEIGDFAILLNSGFTKKKALVLNYVASSSTIPIAIISYYLLDFVKEAVPFFMAISAASFLYISLVDLAPELHQRIGWRHTVKQLIMITAGVIVMLILFQFHVNAE